MTWWKNQLRDFMEAILNFALKNKYLKGEKLTSSWIIIFAESLAM